MSRPDLRVITLLFDEAVNKTELAQLNFLNTWHRVGKRSSLLDVFLSNKPHRATEIVNVENMMSEHERILLQLDCKASMRQKQFL